MIWGLAYYAVGLVVAVLTIDYSKTWSPLGLKLTPDSHGFARFMGALAITIVSALIWPAVLRLWFLYRHEPEDADELLEDGHRWN